MFDHAQLEQERHQVAVMPIRKLLVQKRCLSACITVFRSQNEPRCAGRYRKNRRAQPKSRAAYLNQMEA